MASSQDSSTPPTMRPWNLALRFALEVAAFFGVGLTVWASVADGWKWVATIGAVVIVIGAWGTFNVPGDPSRSGRAPVEVAGWVRLSIELIILGGAAVALIGVGRTSLGSWVGGLTVLHYLVAWKRTVWLVRAHR